MRDQVRQLRAQIQQRDNEIAILVNMVKQLRSQGGSSSGGGGGRAGPAFASSPSSYTTSSSLPPAAHSPSTYLHTPSTSGAYGAAGPSPSSIASMAPQAPPHAPQPAGSSTFGPAAGVGSMLAEGSDIPREVLMDRSAALKEFKKRYPKMAVRGAACAEYCSLK